MADLIAIGYPDEATAEAAAEEARRLARDLIIEPDAIASIVRDSEGKYHVHTSHHPVGAGATWGMFWGIGLGIIYLVLLFTLAVMTFRKGHWVLGLIGFIFPLLWLIGAILPDKRRHR